MSHRLNSHSFIECCFVWVLVMTIVKETYWPMEDCPTRDIMRFLPISFPGSLFSASLSRWNRDPCCGWSRDHLSIQNRRVSGYSSTFGREDNKIPHPSSRFFYHPDSRWSRDQPQPRSLYLRLREAEKRDPGYAVGFLLDSVHVTEWQTNFHRPVRRTRMSNGMSYVGREKGTASTLLFS